MTTKEQVIKLWPLLNQSNIAKKLGISRQRVAYVLIKNGLYKTKPSLKLTNCQLCGTTKNLRPNIRYKKVCKDCLNRIASEKSIDQELKKITEPCEVCGQPRSHHNILCDRCYSKKRYHTNPEAREKIKLATKKWVANNYEHNKEVVNRNVRAWQKKYPERAKELAKKYREKKRDEINAKAMKRYWENPELFRERDRAYKAKKKDSNKND
jgi:DNA-binding XRE family transcriptional regulator